MPIRLLQSSLVGETEHWTIAVNRNQNLLGKVVLVSRRDIEAVTELNDAEWHALHAQMRRVCAELDELFRPDPYNHAFLMNLDSQVHLHVVPRYASPRDWHGEAFTDPHFGSLFGTEQRILGDERLDRMAAEIRAHLPGDLPPARAQSN